MIIDGRVMKRVRKVRPSEDGRRNSFNNRWIEFHLQGLSFRSFILSIYLDGGLITREWLLFKGFHNVRDGRLNALISLMELVNGGWIIGGWRGPARCSLWAQPPASLPGYRRFYDRVNVGERVQNARNRVWNRLSLAIPSDSFWSVIDGSRERSKSKRECLGEYFSIKNY